MFTLSLFKFFLLQGVTNPTEEMLDRAIDEYYAKNPQGVSSRCLVPGGNTYYLGSAIRKDLCNARAKYDPNVQHVYYSTLVSQ